VLPDAGSTARARCSGLFARRGLRGPTARGAHPIAFSVRLPEPDVSRRWFLVSATVRSPLSFALPRRCLFFTAILSPHRISSKKEMHLELAFAALAASFSLIPSTCLLGHGTRLQYASSCWS
jgi:hypothetical protein